MFRGNLGMTIIAVVALTAGIAVAQDGVNIVVGGDIVARVRAQGAADSVEARAAAINQAVQAACATGNPAGLEVSLKQVDGLWTVFIADRRIMSVYPAEADANGLPPHVLGSIWVEKFKNALPKVSNVTVVDLGNPVTDQPTTPTPTPTPVPATDTVEVLEIPVTGPTQPSVAAAQGAMLLIIDAFNKTRGMDEDTYLREREQQANGLLDNLIRVWTGGQHGSPEEPAVAVPDTSVSTITVLPETAAPPPTTTVETIALGPAPATDTTVTVIDSGPVTPTATATTGTTTSTAELTADIPAGDPSYAKVPQKRRIGKKFEAARDPYLQLKATDPDAAKQISELLKAARREFTDKNFDLSEEYLDGALKMMGVTSW
jgi:hypothetical protein